MKKFTVITVCYNCEAEIRDTILSVLDQTCTDFEYLIKDGASQDETVAVAKSFIPAFDEKNIPYQIFSQSDTGIYDAMNCATRAAQGEWIIYMNAGDLFADETVLEKVKNSGCLETADVVYGDCIRKQEDLYMYKKADILEKMRTVMPFRHQSAFVCRTCFTDNQYDEKYRISSDFKLFLQLYRKGKRFIYIPMPISLCDMTGISADWERKIQEKIQILEEEPVRDEGSIQKLSAQLETVRKNNRKNRFMHQHLWRFVPKKLRQIRFRWIMKKDGWMTADEWLSQKKEKR